MSRCARGSLMYLVPGNFAACKAAPTKDSHMSLPPLFLEHAFVLIMLLDASILHQFQCFKVDRRGTKGAKADIKGFHWERSPRATICSCAPPGPCCLFLEPPAQLSLESSTSILP